MLYNERRKTMRSDTINQTKLKKKSRFRNELDAWILFIPSVIVLYLMIWRPTVLGAVWSFFKMNAYTPRELLRL